MICVNAYTDFMYGRHKTIWTFRNCSYTPLCCFAIVFLCKQCTTQIRLTVTLACCIFSSIACMKMFWNNMTESFLCKQTYIQSYEYTYLPICSIEGTVQYVIAAKLWLRTEWFHQISHSIIDFNKIITLAATCHLGPSMLILGAPYPFPFKIKTIFFTPSF